LCQDAFENSVESVEPRQDPSKHLSLEAIRTVAKQDVFVVITGNIKDACRSTLQELGIDAISGVQGMTVIEAVERCKANCLATPESRQWELTKIAVAAAGEGLEGRLQTGLDACESFTIVDPQTKQWHTLRVVHDTRAHKVNIEGVRASIQSGAAVVITSQLNASCRLALAARAVSAYLAPAGTTVREAIALYERGEPVQARQRYQTEPGEAGSNSTVAKNSRISRPPLRRKRR